MPINIAPTSNDTNISTLMADVGNGKIQLPDFQRGWTWDDNRIKGILASLTQGYPMGAIMSLQYGSESVRFKYRTIEGVKAQGVVPDYLVLDGQQRLTSMWRATCSSDPVDTVTEKKKGIQRYYYLDINACLDDNVDRLDAILSVPKDRKIKENFDRDVKMDLSSRELEYEHEMFPVNIVFNSNETLDWVFGYMGHYKNAPEYMMKLKRFQNEILNVITDYKLPVIRLDKSTPRDAVCKVFENVNTGGVSLTVFELVTATYATYGHDLREDWEHCKDIIWGLHEQLNTDVMYGVEESLFLQAVTLYSSFKKKDMLGDAAPAISCKRKDILDLPFDDYKESKDAVLEGFKLARKFLFSQYVFRQRDLPYTTQLVPLAAICAVIGKSVYDQPKTQSILTQWFWCGIMGEMYGGANDTRFANDIDDVIKAIRGKGTVIRTINASFFSATRLLSLQTRNSAAYKGIMALIYRAQCRDFMTGITMDVVKSMDESPDIHHIFPEAYCDSRYKKEKWNSIVNKTPILYASNRSIGGSAPSIYLKKIMNIAGIDENQLKQRIESHFINYNALSTDNFDVYFVDRAKKLLSIIEDAMGKKVADRGSEQTINAFGCSLEESYSYGFNSNTTGLDYTNAGSSKMVFVVAKDMI